MEVTPAAASLEPPSGTIVDTAETAPIATAPEHRIRVVANPWLARLLIAAPIGVGLVLAVSGFYLDDPMFGTGLVAVIVVFVVFQVFARWLPEALERLRLRQIVGPGEQARFTAFEAGTERMMNNRIGLVPAAVFVVFALARYPVAAGGLDGFLFGSGPRSLGRAGPLMLLDMLGETLLGLALGLVLWRMLVAALKVRELGDRFELRLQLNHPDRCGGFRPIGDLCLWNAFLVTVPAVYLAAWVVLAPRIPMYGTTYVGLHTAFLGVLAVLAPVTFVAPLWTIHRSMVREATRLRVEVEQLGQQIDRLSRDLLERSDELKPDEIAALARDIDVRQQSYKRSEQIPTWPIDIGLALRFGTSQAIPLLGLTGLGKPVIDAIERLAKFAAAG